MSGPTTVTPVGRHTEITARYRTLSTRNGPERLLQPRGGSGDKLPLSYKCPSRRASQIASDNQSPTPSLLVWLILKPGGTASTDRRRGEGE